MRFSSVLSLPSQPKIHKKSIEETSEASFLEGHRLESIWSWILWAWWLQKSSEFDETFVKHMILRISLHLLGDAISSKTCKTHHFRYFSPLPSLPKLLKIDSHFDHVWRQLPKYLQISLLEFIFAMFAAVGTFREANEGMEIQWRNNPTKSWKPCVQKLGSNMKRVAKDPFRWKLASNIAYGMIRWRNNKSIDR